MTDVASAPGGPETFAGAGATGVPGPALPGAGVAGNGAAGMAPTLARPDGPGAGLGVATAPMSPTQGLVDDAVRALPLEALHDVELHVEVVLGRARMALRDLLAAHPGTTIELDRAVHSTVDVMVNGTLFARGEMVVVDDSEIGVQITEVIGVDAGRDGRS